MQARFIIDLLRALMKKHKATPSLPRRLLAPGQRARGLARWLCVAAASSRLVTWAQEVASSPAPGLGASEPLAATATATAVAPGSSPSWALAWLFACVALAVFIWAWKKQGRSWRLGVAMPRAVRVLERTALGANAQLVVVEYRGRHLLLSVASGQARCLRDDPVALDPTPGDDVGGG
jgi:flagellar biogenesis protein FliO